MKTNAIIALFLLLLAGIAFRFLWTLPSPIGTGRYAESPDTSYIAHASTLTSRSFFCGERHHYEFRVEDRERRVLRVFDVDPKKGSLVSWRDDGIIEWAGSHSVVYTAPGIQFTLDLK